MSMRECAGLVLLCSMCGFGQKSFDVASVRIHEGPSRGRPGVFTSGTRLEGNARTIVTLVMFAYNVKSYQVAPTRALEPLAIRFTT